MDKKGILSKEATKDCVDEVLSRGKYKGQIDNEKLPRKDKLKVVNGALTDIHISILGSGRVSTTEAKNFRHFIKKKMEAMVKADAKEGEKAGGMLTSVVWDAFDAYIKFKLDEIGNIKKKKASRIQKILDRAEKRRKG